MAKTVVTLAEFKTAMLHMGYHVKVRRFSTFGKASVLHSRGPVNDGNVITQQHLDTHAAFYEYAKSHSVREGDYVIVI